MAARLLAAVGSPAALDALGPVLEGEQLVSLAVRPSRSRRGRARPGRRGVRRPGGARRRRAPTRAGRRCRPHRGRQPGSAPLADVRLVDGAVLADGRRRRAAFERALDEWLVLTAAAVVGSGTVALEIGCAYAIERKAFGSPIGSFQGISHPLADDATNLDGARLLVHKAAWELDRGGAAGRELAAMAFAFASTAAEKATYDSLHTHGGYGFMLEYDVQLHWRRARGWPRVWGDAEAGYRRAAARALRDGSEALMDFEWDDDTEAFREEVRRFLAEHLTPELEDELYEPGPHPRRRLRPRARRAALDRRRLGARGLRGARRAPRCTCSRRSSAEPRRPTTRCPPR